ncbi:MAG TPA: PIN domain-containing protein [Flavisolibacter sp.]
MTLWSGKKFRPGPFSSKSRCILNHFTIVPIFYSIRRYAQEKVRLQKLGTLLHDEFDMLIGATAIENDFVLVTSNTKHFARFENIQLENWLTA